MRRYGIRVLVAVLTFALGLALSFALGLFRGPLARFSHKWSESRSCRKEFRLAKPSVLTVDSQLNEPLQVTPLGATLHSDMAENSGVRLLIQNRSNKTITDYAIGAERSWRESGKSGVSFFDSTGNLRLEPGESQTITLHRAVDSRFLVRVESVGFEDGSRWNNPRSSR